jgi:hypothetical protein
MDHPNSVDLTPEAAAAEALASRTETSLTLPAELSFEAWAEVGRQLDRGVSSLQWWLGDWWAFGEHHYGERTRLVEAWDSGPAVQTCKNCACVSRRFETSRRRDLLPFAHHEEVAALPPADADALLAWCEETLTEGGRPRSRRELRAEKKRRLTAPPPPPPPDEPDEPEPGDEDEGKDAGERGDPAPDIFCRVTIKGVSREIADARRPAEQAQRLLAQAQEQLERYPEDARTELLAGARVIVSAWTAVVTALSPKPKYTQPEKPITYVPPRNPPQEAVH